MFASDAGKSHGGFEYNAEWNATLVVRDNTGTLKLELDIGLGDALKKHEYSVTEFIQDRDKVSMKVDGRPIVLVWVTSDEIWNHTYDAYYIASWGSDSPPEELRGEISSITFPGLGDSYYLELRLK